MRRLGASGFVGLVVIRMVQRPVALRVGLYCLMVLILEVMQRPGVMRAAYFEFKRPSIGTFESPLQRSAQTPGATRIMASGVLSTRANSSYGE